jgi:hypothetical protein
VDPPPRRAAVELLTPLDERPRASFVSLDGRRIVVKPEQADAYVRDVDGPARQRLPGTRGAPGRWFLDRRGTVAVHVADETATLWDLATRTPHDVNVTTRATRPAFTARGDRVAFAVDAEIHIFDTRTAALVRRLVGHEGPVETLEFADDGRSLVSGAIDRTVRNWDLGTGRSEVHAGFEGIVSEVRTLADGRSILAVSTAGEARLFEPHRAGQVVTEHDAPTTGLALSADDRVASIDEQGQLRISDLAGVRVAEHTTPRARQIHLVTAPDGRSFAGVPRAWITMSDGRRPDRTAPPATLLLGTFDAAAPASIPLPAAALDLAWLADAVLVALVDGAVLRVDRSGAVTELHRFAAPATSVTASTSGLWIAAGRRGRRRAPDRGRDRPSPRSAAPHRARHRPRVLRRTTSGSPAAAPTTRPACGASRTGRSARTTRAVTASSRSRSPPTATR